MPPCGLGDGNRSPQRHGHPTSSSRPAAGFCQVRDGGTVCGGLGGSGLIWSGRSSAPEARWGSRDGLGRRDACQRASPLNAAATATPAIHQAFRGCLLVDALESGGVPSGMIRAIRSWSLGVTVSTPPASSSAIALKLACSRGDATSSPLSTPARARRRADSTAGVAHSLPFPRRSRRASCK